MNMNNEYTKENKEPEILNNNSICKNFEFTKEKKEPEILSDNSICKILPYYQHYLNKKKKYEYPSFDFCLWRKCGL